VKKPYVIAHMVSSIDGRSTNENWPKKNKKQMAHVFESVAEKIKADAWLVGRTTMQEFSSKKAHRLGAADRKIQKTDFIGKHKAKTYAVAVDAQGKCRWDTNMVSTEHVIEVLTEAVSTAYLKHLREKEVSYIFAGAKEIDLELALKKLRKLFGIKIVRVDGGGRTWGQFLKASLIDEISHVALPVADGAIGTNTIFDAEEGHTARKAKSLRLKSVKQLAQDCVWLRYKVKN
jgi:2,5-diamino-6-(ribosylamino)-4(3H)-pyrimidinone 5'-phosphate reductase